MTGTRLAHYDLLEKLGAGGMGEVYKARDSRLNRFVALKILSGAALANPDRRLRFVHEAQAASALNHAHIVTVYDIAAEGETPYIAMEFVDGRTLDAVIGNRGLRLSEALRYAIAIADALAAAHEAGLVHRDLKPGNIMISEKGAVKVVDFGLAKLAERVEPPPDAATRTLQPNTEEGTILGTVSYMSPEQAQGKKVDARSDIFAFGLVLYEMITGRRAFSGDTKLSTLAAILNQEPKPVSQIAPGLPREIERIIGLCLRKDPARRFQHMEDVRVSLEAAKEESDSMSGPIEALPRSRQRWWRPVAAAALVAGALGWYFLRPAAAPVAPPKIMPLTVYKGSERDPSFSPDGTQVAFSWDGEKEDNFDIYVRLITGGAPLRLTSDPAPDFGPAWSPDGTQIAFVRSGQGVYLISPLGGQERKLTGFANSVAWTPDGKALAFSDRNLDSEPFRVSLLTVTTGEKRTLTAPPPKIYGDLDPAFSPDGKQLCFVRWQTQVGASDLYVAPVAGGEARRITADGLWVYNPVWTPDGRDIVFSSNRTGGQNLWRLAAGGGTPQQLGFVQGEARLSAFSAPGRGKPVRFAYGASVLDDNIWGLEPAGGAAKQIIASTRRDWSAQLSPDGRRIAFSSDRSGNFEIWVAKADGSNPVQLTFFAGGILDSPRWSPDGTQIAFAALAGSNRDIYVVPADGGSARRLTSEPSEEGRPSWSNDGHTIYFRSDRSGTLQIWKVAAQGGTASPVTRAGGFEAFESPDGKLLYYTKGRRGAGLWSLPLAGGEESKVLDGVQSGYWAIADKGIFFVEANVPGGLNSTAVKTVKMFSFDTRQSKQVASIDRPINSAAPAFSAARDGRSMVWTQLDRMGSDLVLVENFR